MQRTLERLLTVAFVTFVARSPIAAAASMSMLKLPELVASLTSKEPKVVAQACELLDRAVVAEGFGRFQSITPGVRVHRDKSFPVAFLPFVTALLQQLTSEAPSQVDPSTVKHATHVLYLLCRASKSFTRWIYTVPKFVGIYLRLLRASIPSNVDLAIVLLKTLQYVVSLEKKACLVMRLEGGMKILMACIGNGGGSTTGRNANGAQEHTTAQQKQLKLLVELLLTVIKANERNSTALVNQCLPHLANLLCVCRNQQGHVRVFQTTLQILEKLCKEKKILMALQGSAIVTAVAEEPADPNAAPKPASSEPAALPLPTVLPPPSAAVTALLSSLGPGVTSFMAWCMSTLLTSKQDVLNVLLRLIFQLAGSKNGFAALIANGGVDTLLPAIQSQLHKSSTVRATTALIWQQQRQSFGHLRPKVDVLYRFHEAGVKVYFTKEGIPVSEKVWLGDQAEKGADANARIDSSSAASTTTIAPPSEIEPAELVAEPAVERESSPSPALAPAVPQTDLIDSLVEPTVELALPVIDSTPAAVSSAAKEDDLSDGERTPVHDVSDTEADADAGDADGDADEGAKDTADSDSDGDASGGGEDSGDEAPAVKRKTAGKKKVVTAEKDAGASALTTVVPTPAELEKIKTLLAQVMQTIAAPTGSSATGPADTPSSDAPTLAASFFSSSIPSLGLSADEREFAFHFSPELWDPDSPATEGRFQEEQAEVQSERWREPKTVEEFAIKIPSPFTPDGRPGISANPRAEPLVDTNPLVLIEKMRESTRRYVQPQSFLGRVVYDRDAGGSLLHRPIPTATAPTVLGVMEVPEKSASPSTASSTSSSGEDAMSSLLAASSIASADAPGSSSSSDASPAETTSAAAKKSPATSPRAKKKPASAGRLSTKATTSTTTASVRTATSAMSDLMLDGSKKVLSTGRPFAAGKKTDGSPAPSNKLASAAASKPTTPSSTVKPAASASKPSTPSATKATIRSAPSQRRATAPTGKTVLGSATSSSSKAASGSASGAASPAPPGKVLSIPSPSSSPSLSGLTPSSSASSLRSIHSASGGGGVGSSSTTANRPSVILPPLHFESRFESGNLHRVVLVTPSQYDLVLSTDVNSRGYTQWFFFQVRGMLPGVRYQFNMLNLEKHHSTFNTGMKPVMHSAKIQEKEGIGWHRACAVEEVAYYHNLHCRPYEDAASRLKVGTGQQQAEGDASSTAAAAAAGGEEGEEGEESEKEDETLDDADAIEPESQTVDDDALPAAAKKKKALPLKKKLLGRASGASVKASPAASPAQSPAPSPRASAAASRSAVSPRASSAASAPSPRRSLAMNNDSAAAASATVTLGKPAAVRVSSATTRTSTTPRKAASDASQPSSTASVGPGGSSSSDVLEFDMTPSGAPPQPKKRLGKKKSSKAKAPVGGGEKSDSIGGVGKKRKVIKKSSSKKSAETFYTLTFSMKFPYAEDTVLLAYHFPFTYTFQRECLDYLQASSSLANSCMRRQKLTVTRGGNLCELVTITDFARSKHELEAVKRRKLVVLSARIHPGESNASWLMKGLLEFLTGASEQASWLRQHCVFKIVPMLNCGQ
jgi:hypothetical protein